GGAASAARLPAVGSGPEGGPPHAGDRARERAGHRERDPAEPRDATPDGGAAARLPRAPLARVALTGGRGSGTEDLHEARLDLLVALHGALRCLSPGRPSG